MKITLFPYHPFLVEESGLTVFDFSNPKQYTQFVNSLVFGEEGLVVSINDKIVSPDRAIDWIGEPFADVLQQSLSKKLVKFVATQLQNSDQISLLEEFRQLQNHLQQLMTANNWPFKVDSTVDVAAIVKAIGPKAPPIPITEVYDNIELCCKTRQIMSLDNPCAFLNASHYLTRKELAQLEETSRQYNAAIIVGEFSSVRREHLFENSRYYFIDDDFVDWRYLPHE
ncbi:type II-A CRISPR-associated protein Csn2 [Schleiferilactobacillus harbinensis]|uniref:type II-A CRISPR-associated protein Csn2 n=1 Tax=Schleiferilactobacillus harbinensis TaxID=304207 RepID=UPI0012391EAD|nr:type II-A CRISPR-associated protein Csn2 [Schleiferilactobacillus harbinensis]QEU47553.1 type II-A CRISPR-associated protein Csn2 [Schleiferilactobacillus harbinensis]